MALTGDVWTGVYDGRTYRIHWDATQSVAKNSSTVKWQIICGGGNSSWYAEYAVYAKINGKMVYSKTNRVERYAGTVASGTIEIPHNNDGTKSFSASLQVACYTSSINLTGSKTFTLNKIARAATITSAPNFTDEGNPTIEYSNPAGNIVEAVDVCISLDGSKDDIAYRAVSATGSSYTFNLTEAERNVLRNATTANSRTVRFYIRTTISGEQYLSYVSKTFTVTDAFPTMNPTAADIDAGMLALTGDSNRIVRYYSNIQYAFNATALKGATIKSYSAVCGNETKTTATGFFYDTDSANITFKVTDSRGNTTSKTISKTLIAYIRPTVTVKGSFNTDGIISYEIEGNYWAGNFGAVANTLLLEVRLFDANDTFITSTTITPANSTITDNKYKQSGTFTGLDYRSAYKVQVEIKDKINSINSNLLSLRATPVFDWGADDFNINGSLSFRDKKVLRVNGDNNNTVLSAEEADNGIFFRPNGTGSSEAQAYLTKDNRLYTENGFSIYGKDSSGTAKKALSLYDSWGDLRLNDAGYDDKFGTTYINGNFIQLRSRDKIFINGIAYEGNKVLWSGSHFMTAGHTAELSEEVHKQVNGIVLVFSRYSGSAAVDWNWQTYFIPKKMVELYNGGGHSITLMSNGMAGFGQKYIYVYNDRITGHENNNKSGTSTATNIKYDNALFVMRYVIGV